MGGPVAVSPDTPNFLRFVDALAVENLLWSGEVLRERGHLVHTRSNKKKKKLREVSRTEDGDTHTHLQ